MRKRARLKQKEDVDIETSWDAEQEAYVINMTGKGTTKQVVIPESNLHDRQKMLKFFHRYAKMTYDTI